MSYKLLQVSQLSALGVIGDDYLNYPLYKHDLLMATIGTESSSLSTAKVTIEELTQAIFQVGNTTSPWISADVGAVKRVYAPGHAVAIGSSNWASEHPYEAKLTVLGGVSSNQGLSAAPTKQGFRTVLMGNVGINTNTFGTSETYRLNVAGNANVSGNLTIGGNTDITGNLTVGGNIDGGDATADTFTITALVDSDIVPDTDSSRDIGTSAKRWALGYFDTVHLTDDLELVDGGELRLGSDDDLLLYHSGTHGYAVNKTGDYVIQNEANDKDITLKTDDGSGGVTTYINCDGDTTAVALNFGGSTKFQTAAVGTSTTGSVSASNGLVSTVQSPHPPLAVASTVEVANLNAAKLKGKILSTSGDRWDVIPLVDSSGVMEVGKFINFHNSDGDASDGAVRLHTNGGTTDLYIAPGVTGSSEKVYTDADGSFTTAKQTAFAYVIFSAASNGTVTIHNAQMHNIASVTEVTFSATGDNVGKAYRITYINSASTQYYPNFTDTEPRFSFNEVIETFAGRHHNSGAGFPADGSFAEILIYRGFMQGADDGDTHVRYLIAQLGNINGGGNNLHRISYIAFDVGSS